MNDRLLGRARLSLVALTLLAALSHGHVAPAFAHALLLRSLPEADAELAEAPAAIELWFSEPLEPSLSGMRLLSATGQELAVGAALVDPADPAHLTVPVGQLAPGVYTVAWHNYSRADGHPWQGSFPFTVLNPDGSRPAGEAGATAGGRGELPGAGEALGRWLMLLGGLVWLGAPLFQRVVLRQGRAFSEPNARLESAVTELAVLALWAAGAAAVIGHWLPIVLRAAQLSDPAQLPVLIFGGRPAALALGRQALFGAGLLVALGLPLPPGLAERRRWLRLGISAYLAGLVALLGLAAWRGEGLGLAGALTAGGLGLALGQTGRVERRKWEALLLLAAAALMGHSLTSHAAGMAGSLWAILSDYLHLLAAAAWAGGLLLLPFVLWRARAIFGGRLAPALPLVQRFSHLAGLAVYVIVLTGLFNSLVQLPTPEALFSTTYGWVLVLKLGLTALTLGLAFLNRRLVQRPEGSFSVADRGRALGRQVAVEAALALGLLASVAVLVQTPTPRALAAYSPPALPFNATASADDLYLHVQVTPNRAGRNRFWIHLYHEAGAPIGEVQLVRLSFDYRDAPLGQASVDLEPLGGGTYAAEGAYLNLAGGWDLSVYVRRRGQDDALTRLSLEVPPAGPDLARSAWQNPVPWLPPAAFIAAALAAVGGIPFLWGRPLAARAGSRMLTLQLAGASVLLLAFVYAVVGEEDQNDSTRGAGRRTGKTINKTER